MCCPWPVAPLESCIVIILGTISVYVWAVFTSWLSPLYTHIYGKCRKVLLTLRQYFCDQTSHMGLARAQALY